MPTREIWPDDGDARQVALATRIALFDAWRPRPAELPSPEHEQLVKAVLRSTDPDSVEGRGFRDFLAIAKAELAQDLRPHLGTGSALARAAAAVRRAPPVDVTADMYEQLRALTASAYRQPGIDRLPLERSIVDTRSRSEHVTGAVPASRSRVMLAFDPDFDFRSFTRLPWVLAHELVCHVAGGQTGRYGRGDDRSTRQYFDEGFMSCSAATLLLTWRELPGNDGLASADHLSIDEAQRHHSNPEATRWSRRSCGPSATGERWRSSTAPWAAPWADHAFSGG